MSLLDLDMITFIKTVKRLAMITDKELLKEYLLDITKSKPNRLEYVAAITDILK